MMHFQRSRHVRKRATGLQVEQLESRQLLSGSAMSPLNDLGTGTYQGFMGGLYPNGTDTPPAATETYAENLARQILPLNASGNVDTVHGKIVMISVGMSNTQMEFGTFQNLANGDPTKNHQLVLVNGAQGGRDVDAWINPNSTTWGVVDQQLTSQGVTPAQVEVAWVKLAESAPYRDGVFPAHAQHLQGELEAVIRDLMIKFPHIKIAYLGTRTHAYTTDLTSANPEPYAYETGFAVKWAIQDQINGINNLNYNPAKGAVVAPLLLWGPYTWATSTPRSDGFTWLPTDVISDHIHPSVSGEIKVADQLLAFFKTNPSATPWFLSSWTQAAVSGPVVTIAASATSGAPGLQVQFTAKATDPGAQITQYAWTYDDGDFSLRQNPIKSFLVPGTYFVHLTVSDSRGHTATREITITITASGRMAAVGSAGATTSATAAPGLAALPLQNQPGTPPATVAQPANAMGLKAPNSKLANRNSRPQTRGAFALSKGSTQGPPNSSQTSRSGSANANGLESLVSALTKVRWIEA